jgi:hypothetical protein
MRRFASREWVAELDACLARAALPVDTPPLVVHYVVTDVPAPEAPGPHAPDPPARRSTTSCYRIQLEGGRLRAVHGGPAGEDDRTSVTFTQPYPVAAAIARGELAAQTAILDGRLRVHGAVASLPAWRRCLPAIDAALEELRGRTSY